MGRLDDIIQRNKHPKRFGERITVGIGLTLFLLLVIVMMVCTDLGLPPEAKQGAAPPPVERGKTVDGVRLMAPPAAGSGSAAR